MLKETILFLCVLLALSENWQASGNFSAANITFIFETIDNTLKYITDGTLPATGKAKNISDTLNAAWSPAWNVFTLVAFKATTDSVVYGYAFNGHWFWINNYQNKSLGNFVIWKDYNCHTWMDASAPNLVKMAA